MKPRRRPRIIPTLGLWWAIAAGLAVGLLLAYLDHLRRAGIVLAGVLVVGAVARAILPEERIGGLVVRSRLFDVVTLLVLAAALTVVTLSLKLSPPF
jgi:Protein of unknown function (DUF3017)